MKRGVAVRSVGAWIAACGMAGAFVPGTSTAAALQARRGAAAAKPAVPAKPTAVVQNPIPMSENSVKAGRVVYAKICRACHGLQGKGDGVSAPPGSKPANLVDAEWKYGSSDGEIFKTIKEGVKPFDVMEPWGKKVSDTEIWQTINFLRDLGKRAAVKK